MPLISPLMPVPTVYCLLMALFYTHHPDRQRSYFQKHCVLLDLFCVIKKAVLISLIKGLMQNYRDCFRDLC